LILWAIGAARLRDFFADCRHNGGSFILLFCQPFHHVGRKSEGKGFGPFLGRFPLAALTSARAAALGGLGGLGGLGHFDASEIFFIALLFDDTKIRRSLISCNTLIKLFLNYFSEPTQVTENQRNKKARPTLRRTG